MRWDLLRWNTATGPKNIKIELIEGSSWITRRRRMATCGERGREGEIMEDKPFGVNKLDSKLPNYPSFVSTLPIKLAKSGLAHDIKFVFADNILSRIQCWHANNYLWSYCPLGHRIRIEDIANRHSPFKCWQFIKNLPDKSCRAVHRIEISAHCDGRSVII